MRADRGYRDDVEVEVEREELHATCLDCQRSLPNLRYRPRVALADLRDRRHHYNRGSDQRRALCADCFHSRTPEWAAPPARCLPTGYRKGAPYTACTNGTLVPAANTPAQTAQFLRDCQQWLDPPPVIDEEAVSSSGKKGKAEKSKFAKAKAKFEKGKQSKRSDSVSWVSESSNIALHQCRDCFRPFAPQVDRGRVPAHYHCVSCDDRVCSFCRGPPEDAFLLFALQRLSLAKMFQPHLLSEGSPCEHLESFDLIEEWLGPILSQGCCGKALVVQPIARTVTTVQEMADQRGHGQQRARGGELTRQIPARALVCLGPVESVPKVDVLRCSAGHSLSPFAASWTHCSYCGKNSHTFSCQRCNAGGVEYHLCRDCSAEARYVVGDACEVNEAGRWVPGEVVEVRLSRGIPLQPDCPQQCNSPTGFWGRQNPHEGFLTEYGHDRTCPHHGKEDRGVPEPSWVKVSLEDGEVEIRLESKKLRHGSGMRELVRITRDHRVPLVDGEGENEEAELLMDAAVSTCATMDTALFQPLTPVAYEMTVSATKRSRQPELQQMLKVQKAENRQRDIQSEQMRGICWGGDTWIFVQDDRRYIRLRNVAVGDRVLTADGRTYRAVTRVWVTDYTDPKRNTECVYYRGVWMTSHHPVLLGSDFRYPADLEASFPAPQVAAAIGPMYNLELSGHLDTVVLCGGDSAPVWPPLASCTVGKYLGKAFGFGLWTRRSTRCARNCSQCDSVFTPGFNPTRVQSSLRWATFQPFDEVEYAQGQRATFGPAQAQRVWNSAGLSRGGEAGHCSAEEAFAATLRNGDRRAATKTNANPAWRATMLKALDERVTSGQQQFSPAALKSLIGHHDAPAAGQAPPADATHAAGELPPAPRAAGVERKYQQALSGALSPAQRAMYLKMQQRRAARETRAQPNAAEAEERAEPPAAVPLAEPPDADATKVTEGATCSLCLGSFADGSEMVRPCVEDSCAAVACAGCWERYLQLTMGLNSTRFACPLIPCFSCHTVLPTDAWQGSSDAAAQLSAGYAQRAEQLMTVQCAHCRHTASILPDADPEQAGGTSSLLEALRGATKCEFPDEQALRRAEEAWLRCTEGAAEQLAAQLLTLPLDAAHLHASLRAVRDVERRLALQLALLARNPAVPAAAIGCSCTGATCFNCKQPAHGAGGTCRRTNADKHQHGSKQQACPSCAVPAPAHDPECASVLCVCGKYYGMSRCFLDLRAVRLSNPKSITISETVEPTTEPNSEAVQ